MKEEITHKAFVIYKGQKIDLDLSEKEIEKVKRLKSLYRRQTAERMLAKNEGREPDLKSIKY